MEFSICSTEYFLSSKHGHVSVWFELGAALEAQSIVRCAIGTDLRIKESPHLIILSWELDLGAAKPHSTQEFFLQLH